MAKRIYVGSLPYSTTDEQLKNIFTPYGAVTDGQVIFDRFTGQSKGFAFVEMENESDANVAISALNGTAFGGRTLIVNEARERENRAASPARYNNGSAPNRGSYERRSGGPPR